MTTEANNDLDCPCCGGQHGYVLDLVAELDAARAERDAAIDENIRLMNAETEALRVQLREARASAQNIAKELMAALNEPMYAGSRADWMERAQKAEMECDDARAREQRLEAALHSLRCAVCREPGAKGWCQSCFDRACKEVDQARGAWAREAKLRDVLVRIKADHDGRLDMEDCGCGICEDVRAALAEGEDTPPVVKDSLTTDGRVVRDSAEDK